MTGYIYALIDPRDNNVKYVGQTRFSLKKRYLEHLRNSKYDTTKNHNVYCWINELNAIQLQPIISEIEIVHIELLNEREIFWINYYGYQLKNMTCGGNGIGFINKRPFSAKHRKNIGDSCRGSKHYKYGKPAINRKEICAHDIKNGVLIETYQSIKTASVKHKISASAISLCLKGERYSSGGYIWLYKHQTENDLKIKLELCKQHHSNDVASIKVSQINMATNQIINTFSSIREAARSVKSSDVAIKYACSESKTHVYKNFKWKLL